MDNTCAEMSSFLERHRKIHQLQSQSLFSTRLPLAGKVNYDHNATHSLG